MLTFNCFSDDSESSAIIITLSKYYLHLSVSIHILPNLQIIIGCSIPSNAYSILFCPKCLTPWKKIKLNIPFCL